MKIVFFTFYYPPDLSAGSFRAVAFARALVKKLNANDELHVITTHPNRYAKYYREVEDIEVDEQVIIHRIAVPGHQNRMISQMRTFAVFSFYAYRLSKKLKPDFLIGTTSRLMTGILTSLSARSQQRKYYIDLRDIFSETISDLLTPRSRFLSSITKSFFNFLEKRVFNNASGVNIVSEAFTEYFQAEGIDTSSWTFFPNGVDQEFLNFPLVSKSANKSIKTIMYAGNIGRGQGLETVIPEAAKRLGSNYRFVIVGDGSTISKIRDAIKRESVTNVEILLPVGRSDLIEYYNNADILFLHLNNVPAFRRVLPSKIFEYAALGKPIVAGLSGYSAQFLRDNIPSAHLFNPGDAAGAVSCIQEVKVLDESDDLISNFVNKYSRAAIMNQMTNHLIDIIECNLKKIAIVTNSSWYAWNMRLNLGFALQEQGYEVVFICPHDKYSENIKEHFNYVDVGLNPKGTKPIEDLKIIYDYYKIYKYIKPDVVLQYTIKPNIYGTIAAGLLNIPTINNITGLGIPFVKQNIITKIVKWLYKVSQKKATKIFFQNHDDFKIFSDEGLVAQEKCDVLPGSGVDIETFKPLEKEDDGEFKFLVASRLLWEKGIQEFVDAAEIIKQKYPNVQFQILGHFDEQNPSAISKEQMNLWIKDGYINYLGSSDNVRIEISRADCVVLPSFYREGTPRILLESASMAKPIITTDNVGCRDVVDDGINGYLCEVRNVQDLASKMELMINLPDKDRETMGKAGRDKMIEEFSEEIVLNKYLKNISEIL